MVPSFDIAEVFCFVRKLVTLDRQTIVYEGPLSLELKITLDGQPANVLFKTQNEHRMKPERPKLVFRPRVFLKKIFVYFYDHVNNYLKNRSFLNTGSLFYVINKTIN